MPLTKEISPSGSFPQQRTVSLPHYMSSEQESREFLRRQGPEVSLPPAHIAQHPQSVLVERLRAECCDKGGTPDEQLCDECDTPCQAEMQRWVLTALIGSPYPELRRVAVIVSQDCVELDGSVSSFYMKQTAQEIAKRVLPSHRIINRLGVCACKPR